MNHLVFVYGTLRKHECNHFYLNGARCVALNCWTNGKLYDPNLGYPFLAQSECDQVFGELYQVDDEQLASLDQLEDYEGPGKNNLYDRNVQTIHTAGGTHQAFVYVLPIGSSVGEMVPIEGGDWCKYRASKQI